MIRNNRVKKPEKEYNEYNISHLISPEELSKVLERYEKIIQDCLNENQSRYDYSSLMEMKDGLSDLIEMGLLSKLGNLEWQAKDLREKFTGVTGGV
jgi:hypothetical protein